MSGNFELSYNQGMNQMEITMRFFRKSQCRLESLEACSLVQPLKPNLDNPWGITMRILLLFILIFPLNALAVDNMMINSDIKEIKLQKNQK